MNDFTISTASSYEDIRDIIPRTGGFTVNSIDVLDNEDGSYCIDGEITVKSENIVNTIWAILIIDDFILENQNIYDDMHTDADKEFVEQAEQIVRNYEDSFIAGSKEICINELIAIGRKYNKIPK